MSYDLIEPQYHIPESIRERFPPYFYAALGGELVSVFGTLIFEKDEDDVPCLYYVESTCGWGEALRQTCKKLNMAWLFEYYDALAWYDSDAFDDELGEEVLRYFNSTGKKEDYYQYLISIKERKDIQS